MLYRKYTISNKEESKALISLVSDTNMLFKYTNHIPKFNISDQPTTVIYPNVKGLSKKIYFRKMDLLTIRIPQMSFVLN